MCQWYVSMCEHVHEYHECIVTCMFRQCQKRLRPRWWIERVKEIERLTCVFVCVQGLIEKAAPTLAATAAISKAVRIPTMAASGIRSYTHTHTLSLSLSLTHTHTHTHTQHTHTTHTHVQLGDGATGAGCWRVGCRSGIGSEQAQL